MENIDWTTFTRRIGINASAEAIMNAWSTQKEIERWFLKKAQFFNQGKPTLASTLIKAGETYQWTWHASDHLAEGEVIEFIEGKKIRFTFLSCEVEVKVIQENNQNILVLKQSSIPTDDESKKNLYVECTRGWTFYMTNLKSIMEGGIDMRNRNGSLVNVINT